MINLNDRKQYINSGHKTMIGMVLCLFGLCLFQVVWAIRPPKKPHQDDRVYLVHSDELKFDMYGEVPDAQIVKGHVHFTHQGAQLWCDSAYFYQQSNSVKAFGHVRFKQGDTLSLTCDRGVYDGQSQMLMARSNVVLKHRRQTLYTDSLDYDKLYDYAYFFEGGRLIDGKDRLSSDWGEYRMDTREATFRFNVRMTNAGRLITTDTLHYDTRSSKAHVTGPSKITQNGSVIDTENAYFDTKTDQAEMYGRSTVVDKDKTITGDSLFYDKNTGLARGYGNVIYIDKVNKNRLECERMNYNEKTGYGWATQKVLAKDYSQKDTLYMHADSMKIYTFNINTDSMYRKVHCFNHVKVYRVDMQAICDSLVANSQDSCMTMYKDPITWNGERQILGEKILVYMQDSTIRDAHVVGQALSVERMPDGKNYNQVSSKLMDAYFTDGVVRRIVATGNVKVIYYPTDDKDSSLIGLNYVESDTMRMYMNKNRQLEKIWMPKPQGTLYPMTQIPPTKYKLPEFAWFEELRPTSPADVFEWRGKAADSTLKVVKRQEAPLQHLNRQKPAVTKPKESEKQ